jgi:hypothetical protein
MKISFFFILLLICINGCKSSYNSNFIGNYETNSPNYAEKWINFLNKKCIAVGVSLELKNDSTYTIGTCSYSANGNWKVRNDTLFLYEILRVKNIDSSLNIENSKEVTDFFLIKKEYLIQNFKSGTENCTLKLEKK